MPDPGTRLGHSECARVPRAFERDHRLSCRFPQRCSAAFVIRLVKLHYLNPADLARKRASCCESDPSGRGNDLPCDLMSAFADRAVTGRSRRRRICRALAEFGAGVGRMLTACRIIDRHRIAECRDRSTKYLTTAFKWLWNALPHVAADASDERSPLSPDHYVANIRPEVLRTPWLTLDLIDNDDIGPATAATHLQ